MSGGLANAARVVIQLAALAGCSGPSTAADGGFPDYGDGPPPTSIQSLHADWPGTGTVVALRGVVVVARLAASSYGEMWVQDAGGGARSGILVVCDYGGSEPSCALDRSTWDNFHVGQVVNLIGTFERHRDAGTPTTYVQYRIVQPVVSWVPAELEPVAASAQANDVTADRLDAEDFKGTYVEVQGPLSVTSTTDTRFASECSPGSADRRYVGFTAAGPGGATLAIGLNLYQTVTACVEDTCPDGTHPCASPITVGQSFGAIRGVVEPHHNSLTGASFLRLSPTTDGDLAP